jgi:hypothetical protein
MIYTIIKHHAPKLSSLLSVRIYFSIIYKYNLSETNANDDRIPCLINLIKRLKSLARFFRFINRRLRLPRKPARKYLCRESAGAGLRASASAAYRTLPLESPRRSRAIPRRLKAFASSASRIPAAETSLRSGGGTFTGAWSQTLGTPRSRQNAAHYCE